MERKINEEDFKKNFKYEYDTFKDYLHHAQWDKEDLTKDEQLKDQLVRVYQRIRSLLNIYEQMIVADRVFDEGYLEQYLGNKY